MRKFLAGLILLAGNAEAARNSSGTMSAVNGPYTPGTVITSAIINARFADIENELTDSLSRSAKGGMTAAFRVTDGAVGAPAFSWTNEAGSGRYRIGAGDFGEAILGTKTGEWTANGLRVTDGAVGTPSLSFFNETGTGLYRQGAGIPALAVGGTKVASWNSGGQGIFGGLTVFVPGSATSNNFSLLEASLSTGNSVTANLGAASSANGSMTLTYTSNATAANSTGCLGIYGSAGSLCVDGNQNASTVGPLAVGTTLAVTNSAALNGGLTIGSSGTAISKSMRGTASWTPGTITSGSVASTTITVIGASASGDCIGGVLDPAPVSGIAVQCIARAGGCDLAIKNQFSSSITLGAATFYCRVLNP